MTSAPRDAPVPGVHPRTPDGRAPGDGRTPGSGVAARLEPAPHVEVATDACRARLDLPAQHGACAVARSGVRQLLRTWDVVDDEHAHDALLVVSELVGNAVRHGRVPLRLDLTLEGTVLTVGVTDSSPGLPQQRTAGGHEEGGRGLTIVTALAQEWGVDPGPGGKRVWACLPLTRR